MGTMAWYYGVGVLVMWGLNLMLFWRIGDFTRDSSVMGFVISIAGVLAMAWPILVPLLIIAWLHDLWQQRND
jgi:hypothetical protein